MSWPPRGWKIPEGIHPTEGGATVGPNYLTIGASGGPGLHDHCQLRNPKRRGTSSTRWWVNSRVASTVALRRGTWESPRCIAEGRPMELSRRSNVNMESIGRLG